MSERRAIPAPPAALTTPALRAAAGCALLLLALQIAGLWGAWRADGPALRPAEVRLRIDPNTATRAELMLLPGIGPKLADNIVAYRESVPAPAFFRATDLDHVARIGPALVAKLQPWLALPGDAETAEPDDPDTSPEAP